LEVFGEADAAADRGGEGDLPVEAAGGEFAAAVDQRQGLCLPALSGHIAVESNMNMMDAGVGSNRTHRRGTMHPHRHSMTGEGTR
jgi:hypothetical protein